MNSIRKAIAGVLFLGYLLILIAYVIGWVVIRLGLIGIQFVPTFVAEIILFLIPDTDVTIKKDLKKFFKDVLKEFD